MRWYPGTNGTAFTRKSVINILLNSLVWASEGFITAGQSTIHVFVDPTIAVRGEGVLVLWSSQENEVRWEELRSLWRVLTLYKNNGQSQRGEI